MFAFSSKLSKKDVFISVGLLLAIMSPAYAVDMSELEQHRVNQLVERIKPVANVRIEGQDSPTAEAETVAVAAEETGPRSAEDIYNTYCKLCHLGGLAGAPKLGDKATWGDRMATKGLDTLVTNAIKGINAMPAKGTCANCSDDEIRITVEYMLEKSQ